MKSLNTYYHICLSCVHSLLLLVYFVNLSSPMLWVACRRSSLSTIMLYCVTFTILLIFHCSFCLASSSSPASHPPVEDAATQKLVIIVLGRLGGGQVGVLKPRPLQKFGHYLALHLPTPNSLSPAGARVPCTNTLLIGALPLLTRVCTKYLNAEMTLDSLRLSVEEWSYGTWRSEWSKEGHN